VSISTVLVYVQTNSKHSELTARIGITVATRQLAWHARPRGMTACADRVETGVLC
jgi:hypothetical protein